MNLKILLKESNALLDHGPVKSGANGSVALMTLSHDALYLGT